MTTSLNQGLDWPSSIFPFHENLIHIHHCSLPSFLFWLSDTSYFPCHNNAHLLSQNESSFIGRPSRSIYIVRSLRHMQGLPRSVVLMSAFPDHSQLVNKNQLPRKHQKNKDNNNIPYTDIGNVQELNEDDQPNTVQQNTKRHILKKTPPSSSHGSSRDIPASLSSLSKRETHSSMSSSQPFSKDSSVIGFKHTFTDQLQKPTSHQSQPSANNSKTHVQSVDKSSINSKMKAHPAEILIDDDNHLHRRGGPSLSPSETYSALPRVVETGSLSPPDLNIVPTRNKKTLSEQHKRKIAEAQKRVWARKLDPEAPPLPKRQHSLATKQRMSAARTGRVMSPESNQKRSVAMKGRTKSPQHRHKIALALQGDRNPNFGRKRSEETRKKISETKKANKSNHSEATRAKISQTKRANARLRAVGALEIWRGKGSEGEGDAGRGTAAAAFRASLEEAHETLMNSLRHRVEEQQKSSQAAAAAAAAAVTWSEPLSSSQSQSTSMTRAKKREATIRSKDERLKKTTMAKTTMAKTTMAKTMGKKAREEQDCVSCQGTGMVACPQCVQAVGIVNPGCLLCYGAGLSACMICMGTGQVITVTQ